MAEVGDGAGGIQAVVWSRMRYLRASMTTDSAWSSRRSRKAEVKVLSVLKTSGH
jgi:hypothetical protein